MKSLVIAVDLKIIVSLNFLKANKAQIRCTLIKIIIIIYIALFSYSKKEQLPALIMRATPSTANSLIRSLMLSEQTWELCKVLTHSIKRK